MKKIYTLLFLMLSTSVAAWAQSIKRDTGIINNAEYEIQIPANWNKKLVMYAHGLMPLLREVGATRIVPRFVVITKAKKSVVQVFQPTATRDDAARLKLTVGETWSAIQSGVFPRRESWACTQCPYRRRCLGC